MFSFYEGRARSSIIQQLVVVIVVVVVVVVVVAAAVAVVISHRYEGFPRDRCYPPGYATFTTATRRRSSLAAARKAYHCSVCIIVYLFV